MIPDLAPPTAPPATPDTPAPSSETTAETLAAHRQAFGGRQKVAVATTPEPSPVVAPEVPQSAPTAEVSSSPPDVPEGGRPRDAEGRFQKGPRSPAAKDVATPADVPRIWELSKQVRELKAKLELAGQTKPPEHAAPPPETRPTPPSVPARPTPDAFETYEAYLDARDAYNRAQWTAEQQAHREAERITTSWTNRVASARLRHADFDAVALETPTPIPPGSLMDAWILESTQGAELLYALHQDPEECQRIAALPPVQQAEALALLGQRLQPSEAVATGATRTASLPAVPRPPTPVRTGPQRPTEELPGDDASLEVHRKTWGTRATRR